uniref:Uncharacterized protein n=1 Tax=Parascaris univalens TaxID=6257 RepID=A0A915BG97_PARUN
MTHKGAEIRIAFIGSPHKSVIFEQLKEAAVKAEKHVSYQDTFYFTFNVDGMESVVELVDPGVEHTGAREMAIRKAQGAMLFYSAFSFASFKQISDLVNDFKYRKSSNKMPVFLICIEDEIVDDCCETSSMGQSSSEGYESETPHTRKSENHWRRRPSMERIRACHEEGKLSRSRGEQLAKAIPADCRFFSITLASFTDSAKLMDNMIRTIRDKQTSKRNRILLRAMSKVPRVQTDGECRSRSPTTKMSADESGKAVVSSVCTIS